MKHRISLLLMSLVGAFFVAGKYGALAGMACAIILSAMLTPRAAACFANNFGILNNTILVMEAFSQFRENLLPLTNLVLDVQDPKTGAREAKPGDTITVKDWRSTVTPYKVSSATGYNTASNVAINSKDRQVTLPNEAWAISIALTPEEYRILESGITKGTGYMTFRDKLSNLMRDGLGVQAITDWFSVITAANFSNYSVSAAGTFGRASEIDLDTKVFGRNVPTTGAQVICTPTLHGEWTKDHLSIQTHTGENRPKTLLMSGGIQSQNSNFTIWRTNRPMPAAAARGFVTTSTAVIAAFRTPDEATFDNDPVSLNTLVDPVTGIPMLARLWKDSKTGIIQLDLAAIWVFAPGQAEAIERIVAAEPQA